MLASLGQNLVKSATGAAQNVANSAVGELQNVANSAVQNVANSAVGAAGNVLNGAAGAIANNAVGELKNVATGAAGNLLNGAAGAIAIPGIEQTLAPGAIGQSLAPGAIGQEPAQVPGQVPAQVPPQVPPPTNDQSSLTPVLKSGFVQLLNTLNEDTGFKQMIADHATSNVYSAIDEKCGKVQQIISNLQNLQADFEKNGSVDYETLKEAVAKYNQGFNLILEGQKQVVGGSKRRNITRRRSSSRAFRKTRGRRQSSR
jgi:hypothetical protein